MSKSAIKTTLALSLLLTMPGAAHALTDHGIGFNLSGPSTAPAIDAEVQGQLRAQSPEWARFKAEYGDDWTVIFDELTGAPHRIYGQGIDLGSTDNPEALEEAARLFIASHADLFKVSPKDLSLTVSSSFDQLYHMSFKQSVRGVDILGAQVDLVFSHGRLVSMGFDVHQDIDLDVRPILGKREALERSRRTLPVAGPAMVTNLGDLVVVPLRGAQASNGELSYHLAWRNTLETEAPNVGNWKSLIDAHTGELLWVHNDVKFASGEVSIDYEERLPDDDLVNTPATFANVIVDRSTEVVTDGDGIYDAPGVTGTLSTELIGPYVTVFNRRKQSSASFSNGDDFTWEFGSDASPAELDTFVGTMIVRQKALDITPDIPELQDQMRANVNTFGSCNAYYNGNINFLLETPICNNTGRIQDVIYHEYGHHYHRTLVQSGSVNGAIGEGSGDYLSATITNDAKIGPTFLKTGTGSGEVRDIEPDKVYPQDVTGSVHEDGKIWAGAMWDLRKIMIQRFGYEEGTAINDRLFALALTQGPSLTSCYAAVLVADDDDGNLSNGTPNQGLIDIAFGAHGLIL